MTSWFRRATSAVTNELDISNSDLTEVPAWVIKRRGLRELRLWRNQITEVPESIAQLTNLETLDLSANEITELPDAIGQLTNLETLNLGDFVGGNRLSRLPDSVAQLGKLRNLYLRDNDFATVPSVLGQLPNLRKIDLQKNRLTELPDTIGQLTNIRELHVSDNQLTGLPDALGQLTEIQGLYLSNNQLTELPDTIGQLTNIQVLDLSNNQLTELPEAIGQLTNLHTLDLSNNQLTELPEAIGDLPSLERLYLHDNPALGIAPELLGPSAGSSIDTDVEGLLAALFEGRKDGAPLLEAKVILVGRGAVGKTSLVRRLIRNEFDPASNPTEGIAISPWALSVGDDEVDLHLWDFGGQEIMHSTHQFFLTSRTVYLLVLAGRAGLETEDAEYWLRLIESFAPESPVVVVRNKFGSQPFALSRNRLERLYPNIVAMVDTECSDEGDGPFGLDELSQELSGAIDQLPHLRDPFPRRWANIKDRLRGLDAGYITWEDYATICNEEGEADPGLQRSLGVYLHHLGVALNFRDDLALRDTHVLNPGWVTNGIYGLITNPDLLDRGGILGLDDIAAILDPNFYPPDRHRFLVELMRKFDLCFALDEAGDRYLFPQLLPLDEPGDLGDLLAQANLRFEYEYDVLPEGLLPRFIVRSSALSDERNQRWRNGVVLEFEDSVAAVVESRADRRIGVSVTGPMHSRRRLLDAVRFEFDLIHARLDSLEVDELVHLPTPDDHLEVSYGRLVRLERNGITGDHVEDSANDRLVPFTVSDLLDGVDTTTRAERALPPPDLDDPEGGPIRLFISYSHADERHRKRLTAHLASMHRNGVITVWHDRELPPGGMVDEEIATQLDTADVMVCLISADFLNSNYCWSKELERALARRVDERLEILPVIIKPCDWRDTPLGQLRALPTDGRPVSQWRPHDQAWVEVVDALKELVSVVQGEAGPRSRRMR